MKTTVHSIRVLTLLVSIGLIGCGGGRIIDPPPGVDQPPVVAPPSLNPTNVDFSGQPQVAIGVVVNDEDLAQVNVTAQIRRQSDGATFAVTNFSRNGSTFTGTFNAPPNGGAVAQVYSATLTVTDGVNPAVVVQPGANITVASPEGAPGPPVP